MRPTDVLKEEHQVILGVLDCLDRMADRLEEGETIERDVLSGTCDFFLRFADRLHHGKEEDRLFPAMEEGGFPHEGGPIPVMLLEHEKGRAFVREMRRAGEAEATSDYCRAARGLSQLLRLHIEKEDHCLFSMAEGALPPDRSRRLLEEFSAWDATVRCREDKAFGLRIAEDLAVRFGRPAAMRSLAGVGCPS